MPAHDGDGLWARLALLLRYLRPVRGRINIALVLMVLRAGVLLAIPWPLKFIVDSVLLDKPLPAWLASWLSHVVPVAAAHPLSHMTLLNVLGLTMLSLGVLDAVLTYTGNRLMSVAGQQAVYALRCDLFAHLQRLPLGFHRRQRSGELMARLGGDVQTLQDFVVALGTGIFSHLLTIVGMVGVMLFIDVRYTLVVAAMVPVLYVVSRRYTRGLRRAVRKARMKEGRLWGFTQEILSCVPMVQAYVREDHEDTRFRRQARQSLAASRHAVELQVRFPPTLSLIIAIATALTVWYGAQRALAGAISVGDLLIFLAYLRGLATPVRQFAKLAGVFTKAGVAAERVGDIFNIQTDLPEPAQPVPLTHCAGRIEMRDVAFGYSRAHTDVGQPQAARGADPQAATEVVQDISFTVEPGQTLALVGATGSGKSTLASMVPRFHDPVRGSVLLDGHDLRTLALSELRHNVAVVQQETLIFNARIWENIAYGRRGAYRREAIQAARAVGVDRIIDALPEGYDTPVGERGGTLSGGQRQCISLARAMLKNAPVLILDEPTAALDAEIEDQVMRAMKVLSEGRTTLVIAHHLGTIVDADMILVLDAGRIVERGRHGPLLAAGGRYAQLWQHQGHHAPVTLHVAR